MAFFLGLGALLVLWLGSREVIRGRITLGEFVAFNAYLTMLSWPMIAFGWVTNMLQRGMASWKRMLEVLDAEPAIQDNGSRTTSQAATQPDLASAARSNSAISCSPTTARPVLDHVSARIEAGQTVALVGVTGSGKSTLISLLPRLYDPPRGTVFIDGVDVRDIPLAVLRGAIGFVSQEPFLFSDTIADNVAFGLDAGGRKAGAEEGGRAGGQRIRGEVGGQEVPDGPQRHWKTTYARGASPMPRRRRGSTRTSPTFPTASTRWSGSAASRSPAARSSAPRSPARSPSIRGS